ncbi:PPC domain-containing protein [Gimesia panareensis]|uniref:PPC domain-containing protein n=1 Tax=Gimesia panareensis TaxID=2527978 RepID=UPI00118A1BA6|nr:PPC domain-containing protein [Gimesia panareensis]QDU50648.1 hypothetical protein Pan110_30000 [Gimesia panareensis]
MRQIRQTIYSWCIFSCCLLTALALYPLPQASAQLPAATLSSLQPVGANPGSAVEVKITGVNLEQVSALQFSHPGITAVQKMKQDPKQKDKQIPVANTFLVTVKPDVPLGVYDVRALSHYGLSSPRSFVVSNLPETVEQEPNDDLEHAQEMQVKSTTDGVITGGDYDVYRFQAKQGQRLLILCEAKQIDAFWEPILTLYDASGKQIQEARDPTFHDLILDFTAPKDGEYSVRVHDLLYAQNRYVGGNNNPCYYRLTINDAPYIDYVFPPAAKAGTQTSFTLYGRNLPGGKATAQLLPCGKPLEALTVEIDVPETAPAKPAIETFQRLRFGSMVAAPSDSMEGFAYRLPAENGPSNSVFIGFATAPVVAEQEPNDTSESPQMVNVPCEIAGRFATVGDRDWYDFEAKKGDVYQIEVLSQRLGVGTDAFLVLQQVNADGTAKDLQEIDDQTLAGIGRRTRVLNVGKYSFNSKTDDPGYRFKVPADGKYRILLRDMYFMTRGDDRFVYRLSIRKEQPDFRLVTATHYPEDLGPQNRNREPWSTLLRRGGVERIDVLVYRWDGFTGDIRLHVKGLPPGVTCEETTVRPYQQTAALIFKADQSVKNWQGPIQVIGEAVIDGKQETRVAEGSAVMALGRTARFVPRSRRTRETILSVTEEQAPCLVTIGAGKVWKTPADTKIKVPVQVTRYGDFKGAVQLIPVVNPDKISSKVMTIPADKDSGEVEIVVDKRAITGPHQMVFEVKTDVQYSKIKADGTPGSPRKLSIRIPTTQINVQVEPVPTGKQEKPAT